MKTPAEPDRALFCRVAVDFEILGPEPNRIWGAVSRFLVKSDKILMLRAKKGVQKQKWKQIYRELFRGRIGQQEFSEKITASLSHLKLARSRKVVYDFLQRYDHRLEPGAPGRQLEQ